MKVAKSVFKSWDKNGNNEVEYDEFLAAVFGDGYNNAVLEMPSMSKKGSCLCVSHGGSLRSCHAQVQVRPHV